jgi:hypothetical protein
VESLGPAKDAVFNSDYLVFHDDSVLRFFPNPEKARLKCAEREFVEIGRVKLGNVLNVSVNQEYCAILTGAGTAASIYVLKFESAEDIAKVALKSADLQTRKAGIRLMRADNPDFTGALYRLGMDLVGARADELNTAVGYLTEAFNSPEIAEEQRQAIFGEIMKIKPPSRREYFLEFGQFRDTEITGEFLKAIVTYLKPAKAALKLIKARKFDCDCRFEDCPEVQLFGALAASVRGNHEEAKGRFQRLGDVSILRTLDLELLRRVSIDLTPEMLILIGKPELPNDQWSINERIAAGRFYEGRIAEALQIAAATMDENWGFENWPKVPQLVDWVDGNRMMQFAAGACSDFDIEGDIPPIFERLVGGVNLAKSGNFRGAVELLGDSVFLYDFLRRFANDPSQWAKVIRQIDDEDIRRCAFHFLIASSPKQAYLQAISELSDIPAMAYVASQLAKADCDLINVVSLRPN